MTAYTPVEGVGPGASLRLNRGQIVTGVTHAVAGPVSLRGLETVTTVCGRQLRPMTTYEPESWPNLRDRDHKHYVTGVCSRCAKLTKPPACRWCGTEVVDDPAGTYGVVGADGSLCCEDRIDDCPACEDGEAHPHQKAA
jgi:hypothetical protein